MILMYHNIGERAGFNTLSSHDFDTHLRYLQSSDRLKLVDLDAYVAALEGGGADGLVTLTFDDAYASIVTKVLPMLERYEAPATVFVPVGHVGKHNEWDSQMGGEMLEILDWEGILEASGSGLVKFGSHGCRHLSMGKLSLQAIEHELAVSKAILEERLGYPVDYFSYPFGQLKDLGRGSRKLVQKVGYKAALTSNWSRRNDKSQLLALNRIEIRGGDDLQRFKQILHRGLDLKYFKQELKNVLFQIGLKR